MRLSGKAKHNILKSTGLLATAAEEQVLSTSSADVAQCSCKLLTAAVYVLTIL